MVGGLIGAALGILHLPRRGEESREKIAKSFRELLDKAGHQLEETRIKMDEFASRGREIYNEGKETFSCALDSCAKDRAEHSAPGAS